MLDTGTKCSINSARDILVGKVNGDVQAERNIFAIVRFPPDLIRPDFGGTGVKYQLVVDSAARDSQAGEQGMDTFSDPVIEGFVR
jgi:hypothetical protein